MNLTLMARPPVSLRSVLRSRGWVRLVPYASSDDCARLSYVDRLESGRVVELKPQTVEGGVRVQSTGRFSQAERAEVTDKVSWMLGLDQDFSDFYAAAVREPKLATRVAAGELDLEALKRSTLSTDELRKQLLAIKGVGSDAAANLLVLLGRYDDLPIDSWATKVVSREWHDGKPVGPGEVEAAFARWGGWKGLAYWNWD